MALPADIAEPQQKGGTAMSLFTLRGSALAGSIVAGLVGAWSVSAVTQERTTPPIFAPNSTLGWIGAGDIRPVPGKVPPLSQDPKYPLAWISTARNPPN